MRKETKAGVGEDGEFSLPGVNLASGKKREKWEREE